MKESVDGCAVFVDVEVPLPSRSKPDGISQTGVRAVEPCIFHFTADWPLKAPVVSLRVDFPLNLPHINPHRPGDFVNPCLFEGSIDEVLHRFGLDRVVDQLIEWLRSAAADQLIDLEQGWEPTRRDQCPSTIVYSAERIIAKTSLRGDVLSTQARYVSIGDSIYISVDEQLTPAEVTFSQALHDNHVGVGILPVFAVRAVDTNRNPLVDAAYQPESVYDFDTLMARADELNVPDIKVLLDNYYRRSVTQVKEDCRTWKRGLLAVVIFLVQRPVPLVGAPGRSVETLPYVVHYTMTEDPLGERQVSVHAAFHSHELSPELLAQTSGIPTDKITTHIVVLGCGSLGSKIALHLGRAGFGKMLFVDSETMSPHNAARHALLYPNRPYAPKAMLMQEAFCNLSHTESRAFDEDAVDVLTKPDKFSDVVKENVRLILDTTASLRLLTAETMSQSLDASPSRLARTIMYGQGRVVVLMVEGAKRKCRVDDLTAHIFEQCRYDSALRKSIAGDDVDPTRLFVGDNCRSLTMPMADSKVSKSAALVSEQLKQWLIEEIPEDAQLCFGIEDSDNIGMQWKQLTLGPSRVLNVEDDSGWQVRALHHVAQTIDNEAHEWGVLETGGALVGHISLQTRTIILAGLVPAPPDSIRERMRFVLGTEGLVPALRTANEDSLGHLMFLGTWHTHPMGGTHSGLDRDTLAKIAKEANGLPAVSLVWTPTNLVCAVGRW